MYPLSAVDGWESQSLAPFKAHFHQDASERTAILAATASIDMVLKHTPR
jgi:hypothetical protein